jgi:exodeoxyribonuclease V alpha subunit
LKEIINTDNQSSFVGVIKRVTFHSPLNGYGIINVEVIDNDKIKDKVTVTVNQPKIFEGVTMSFTGHWIKHPKYGKQFKAESCHELPPATKEAVIRYLSSGFFPGIGPVTAKKIVNYFKDDALDVFRNDIDRLEEVKGINKKKLNVLKNSWRENQEMNNIMLFLQEHMVSTTFSVKIYKEYGINSIPIIKRNPYKLASDISGLGFAMSDKLAMSLG